MLFATHAGVPLPRSSISEGDPAVGPDSGRVPRHDHETLLPAPVHHSQRVLLSLMAFLLLLPAVLSAGHPVAVYGFLASRYIGALWGGGGGPVSKEVGAFLVTDEQVERYRRDSRADMLDIRGGSLFAITKTASGSYRQVRVRTWNSFLPTWLAEDLGGWLDYKEVPYLGDEVKIWLEGDTILAMGHYHPFGGGPSEGDALARRFSVTSEVVVSNGLIPFVYLDGKLLGYGDAGQLSPEVFRSMRAMEKCFTMTPEAVPVSLTRPSAAIEAFVEYLSTDRHVNTSDKTSVAKAVEGLCREFRNDYAEVFNEGYLPSAYGGNLDKVYMLWNLTNAELWACTVRT